ncbi:MAG: Rho termination factor N-terminal domain-containing protein [Proteobacteria bacterium]|nr:Rho termination factor N-terminal domain-containing protein [Pseudomonadota bacterium]MBU1451020.1 Rho termination factor N-terminal domain-containing protein [Pseudomonadota bacterium]MBU2467829.1 Rho termination factor N-terminal domain-containing protein [Pseudomonadota bacterium]MBU2517613.1 Rho termination factor N-terminal domain-containing protein [Pseudomonadota bacterium]
MPTVKELRETARELKIANCSKLNKADLIRAIQLRELARGLKVKNYAKLTEEELIRAVQMAEGNQPCYLQIVDCRQEDCFWIAPCQGR